MTPYKRALNRMNRVTLSPLTPPRKVRDYAKIKYIAIHRNEVGGTGPKLCELFRTVPEYRAITGGIPPYHYVIDRDGTTWQCLRDDEVGANVAGWNTPTIGVCLIGDFRTRSPTDAQYVSLYTLLKSLQEQHGPKIIQGHDEFPGVRKYKECPGDLVNMTNVRQRAAAMLTSDAPNLKLVPSS